MSFEHRIEHAIESLRTVDPIQFRQLARAGKPRARLVPLADTRKGLRSPGKGKGRFRLKPGFDQPLDADVLSAINNGAGATGNIGLTNAGAVSFTPSSGSVNHTSVSRASASRNCSAPSRRASGPVNT